MKLLFQSDDYGITEGVACGALKAIRDGLVRNTGLFVNMPSSRFAAEQIKYYP
ncbi:MAG: ChbG/HpnK family deacetylase, partial [Anaerolineaceae bacterium]